ncbi:MAG: hypothetical protein HYY51_00405 [Candidatus Magasanikbacteria bacterium]|nr:hypothetical protein [Candidatus Magasanikbacteria bacterium]
MTKQQSGKWILLSQRQRISPFPNYMSLEGMTEMLHEYVDMNLKDTMMIYKDRLGIYFHDAKSFEEIGRHIVELLHKDPGMYARFVDLQNKNGTILVEFCKRISSKDLRSFSNEELYNAWLEYEGLYKIVYTSYGTIWIMEDYLNEELYKIIEKRISDNPSQASEMLNILTKQPSAMVSTVHRKALLELAIQIANNHRWKKTLLDATLKDLQSDASLYALMQQHLEAYYWVTRDYEDPVLDIPSIVKLLKELLGQDPREEHKMLLNDLQEIEDKQTEYTSTLALNKEEAGLFQAMRDAAHLKELRKRYVAESLYHFDPVLKEIGKRAHLALKQVRFLKTDQLRRALLDGENLSDEVNEQMTLSLWRAREGKETELTTGEEAEKFYKEFCVADPRMTEFTGMPVSPGKAQGPVKIVMNPDECHKVEKGDVIVSVQVVPSFSTAIIKASAIVCDGGHGITSHPATLAREAGIPCVIQTRFARDVLKDGDMVEVDGYAGLVRKL